MFRRYIAVFFLCLFTGFCLAQQADSSRIFRKRQILLGASTGAFAAGSLVYLNQVWYQQYTSSSFHFFNDNGEWLQMDKCGHAFSTYQTGRLMMRAMQWSGVRNRNTILWGGASGFAYLTVIEVMDGFSSGWGFSWGDMAANTLGSGLCIAQQYAWQEQRIQLKFSFHRSDLAQYRPDLLGDGLQEELLKDYNGQTYWLSVSPGAFMRKSSRFPKWLAVSFGYGAAGMIGGDYNNVLIQDAQGNTLHFDRHRQFYLSLDLDLTKIRTKSKALRTVFQLLNMIKIPAPTLELSNSRVKFHYLYF